MAKRPQNANTEDEDLEPDFTDQPRMNDPIEAAGAHSSGPEDPVAEGDVVYTPPTDPVVKTDAHGRAEILGGFGADQDDVLAEPSASDRHPGDEALADAVRERLAEDSATTDLAIFVAVRNGVAHLRGQVTDMDDADNAEAVAAAVPGIREVVDELDVTTI